MTVGAGKLGGAPGGEVVGSEFVVGHETHRDGQAGPSGAPRGTPGHRGRRRRPARRGCAVLLIISAQRRCSARAAVRCARQCPSARQSRCAGTGPGAAGGPADHLAEDEAEADHVVALRGSGRPPRLGGGQSRTPVPVADLAPVHPVSRSDHPGRWPSTSATVMVALPALAELRPVPGHRASRSISPRSASRWMQVLVRPLVRRRWQGVLRHGRCRRPSATAPEVDHQVAVHPHRHRGADIAVVGEIAHECALDGLEPATLLPRGRSPLGELWSHRVMSGRLRLRTIPRTGVDRSESTAATVPKDVPGRIAAEPASCRYVGPAAPWSGLCWSGRRNRTRVAGLKTRALPLSYARVCASLNVPASAPDSNRIPGWP